LIFCQQFIPRPMLNWIVIGIGDIATRRVIPAIQPSPEAACMAWFTRDPAKQRLTTRGPWTTLDEALTDPAANAVYVATPVFPSRAPGNPISSRR